MVVNTKKVGSIDLPMTGFGTYPMRGDICEAAVGCALSEGYRLIDTAFNYHNEDAVGRAVRNSGIPRSDIMITTKVYHQSFENARASVEASMKNLGTDYLDIVLLHWPFGNYYAAWRVLEDMKKEGYIREIGVSNFAPDRLIDICHYNAEKPVINQAETHLYCQRTKEHVYETKLGIAHEAYSPLGASRANEMFAEPAVRAIAERTGKTPSQVMLRYLIESDTIIVPKSSTPARIAENLDIFDFSLLEEEKEELKKLDKAAPVFGNAEDPDWAEQAVNWEL